MKMNKKIILAFIFLSLMFTTCIDEHILPNFGHVSITSDPVGAAIYKNGDNTGKITPANFDELLSGSYNFSLRLGSFIDTSFSVQLNEGQEYTQNIFLTETNPLGKIALTSIPSGAAIFSEGIDTEKRTPATFDKLQRGDFEFTLKYDLYENHKINVNLDKDETVEINTKLVIAGTAGSLIITSNPLGATIKLDGNITGSVTPDTLVPVSAGQHSITLSLDRYRDTTISTNIVAGSLVEESVLLTVYEPRGSITIDSNPQGAKIFLNDSESELLTPNTLSKVEGGDYSIKLQLENYYDSTFTVTVIEDQNNNVGVIELVEIPIYNITTSSNPFLASSISGTGEYKHGDEVSLVTVANPGYQFTKWTENGSQVSTDTIYNFIATSNRNLIANYNVIGTLIVNSDPIGAEIYLNNESTGFTTPHNFESILAGQYNLTLKLEDFADTSQTILVDRNQITNVGTIFMQDIVPRVEVNLSFREEGSKIIFLYFFNQDVTLNQVVLTKPDGSTLTQSSVQFIPAGREIELAYPEKINGLWKFKFSGNKSGGRKEAFEVEKGLIVN
ncbi:MAG: PEGA domain-containing protein [Ignavibacteriae bacterium]|nr:PEGA domain-containing protein [Ignavibacteriota bacterium]